MGDAAVEKELQLMHAVAFHPNVVALLGACSDARASDARGNPLGVGLMVELARESLYDMLRKPSAPPWKDRSSLLLDTARGMEALGEHLPKPIIHRDLKSLNVRARAKMRRVVV